MKKYSKNKEGRMSGALRVIIPPDQAGDIRDIASEQNLSASEVVRTAVRSYTFLKHWKKAQIAGKKIARQLHIESDEDAVRIFGP